MHVSMTSKQAAASLAAVLVGLSVGCTVGPHYHSPVAPAVASYTPQPQSKETVSSAEPVGNIQHLNPSAQISPQWWTMFQSPELNGMVSEALRNSPTLVQASARLKQAEEELTARTGATKYPLGERRCLGTRGASESLCLRNSFPKSFTLRIAQRLSGCFLCSGPVRRAGNVVSAAIREAQLQAQIEITRKLLGVQQQELKITGQRYRAGGVSDYDVRSQRTVVAQTEAMLPPLQLEMDVVHDQLTLLMGKSPANSRIVSISLASLRLPEELPLSLPFSLVSQRPDIRAAEALLHQASANVGVATANLYPQILLSGSGGDLGTNFTRKTFNFFDVPGPRQCDEFFVMNLQDRIKRSPFSSQPTPSATRLSDERFLRW
jgi:outer membrane protein TolC